MEDTEIVEDTIEKEDGAEEPVKEPEQVEAPRKFRVKDGDYETELDEEEARSLVQQKWAANRRFEEAAKLRKEAESWVGKLGNALRTDPLSVLTAPELGLDFEKLAREYLLGKMDEEKMTPEQKELHALRRERELRAKKEEEDKTNQEFSSKQEAAKAYRSKLEEEFTEILEKTDLPKDTETIRRLCHVKYTANEAGYEMTPSEQAAAVRQTYVEDIRNAAGKLEGDRLLGFLGEDILKKVRSAELARHRKAQNPAAAKGAVTAQAKPADKKRSQREALEAWAREMGVPEED